jgi:hypothetical protein
MNVHVSPLPIIDQYVIQYILIIIYKYIVRQIHRLQSIFVSMLETVIMMISFQKTYEIGLHNS